MPKNASINGDGFRAYSWVPNLDDAANAALCRKYGATEEAVVLSVTSIRSLCGIPFQLVNWQIGNVVNLATGQRKAEWRDYSKSTRGRLVKGYRKDGPFPGEFVTRMVETRGGEDKISDVRAWLKSTAEEPRDVAAVRGSVVHKMIEVRVKPEMVTDELIRWYFDRQWEDEKRKVTPTVTDDDIRFVSDAMTNYFAMRERVPFVILAQEPQVWNLAAGYAGSADVLLWFLGTWELHTAHEGCDSGEVCGEPWVFIPLPDADPVYWQREADLGRVTKEVVEAVGGSVELGDWKTSPDVYTGHVVQSTAYLGAQFVGTDGMIDERLTVLLKFSMRGMVIKIRPDRYQVSFFDFRQDVMMAFLGSCVFARFLAFNKTPAALFTRTITGAAPDILPEEDVDAA